MHVDKRFKPEQIFTKVKVEEVMIVNLTEKNGERITVALVYRSPSSSMKNNDRVTKAIEEVAKIRSEKKIIMGDFNYKEINWDTLQGKGLAQENFIECIQENNLWQQVEENTRFRGTNKPSKLDLIFTNGEELLETLEYESALGKSDHSVLVFTLKGESGQEEKGKKRRMYRKANVEEIIKELEETNWEEVLKIESRDIDEIVQSFNNHYNEVMGRHVPTSSGTRKEHKRPARDEKLSELLKTKNKTSRQCVKTWKETGSRYEYEKIRKEYNRARNKVRAYTRKLRQEYERGIAEKTKGKSNEVWSYMKSKLSDKKGIGKVHKDPEDQKSELTDDDKEKAGIFAKFFISVQTKEPQEEIPKLKKRAIRVKMEKLVITEESVLQLLEEVKVDKAEGPDGISLRMPKSLAKVLYKPITQIFRESLRRNKVPREWKIAWITVIYKNGRRTLARNYRPISLTSVLCKLMEKLIRNPIVEHMKINGLFSNKQYGFIKGRSTGLQLLKAVESWMEALEKGKSVDCIYADFKKAFDKVPHKRLVAKVRAYGIDEDICNWIESFLESRRQRVNVNGQSSEEDDIISGVPQGSVLGPLLFVIYINDLPELVQALLFLFADDSKIWKGIEGNEDIVSLQQDLEIMDRWSKKWLLEFHPDKLKVLHMNLRHEEMGYKYKMGNDEVKETKHEKDLGIIVDVRLNFEEHMEKKVKKANSIMAMIRRAFQFMDKGIFMLLYKGLVRNAMEYGGAVWSPYKMKDIEKVEGVQRRATSSIPGMRKMTYEERLRELNLPTLRFRREREET